MDQVATGDGLSRTIFMTENLQATHWGTTEIRGMAFVVPFQSNNRTDFVHSESNPVTNGLGPRWPGGAKKDAMTYGAGLNFAANSTLKQSIVNSDPTAAEGSRPRPSSLHPNVVNVFFGDGHGQTIAQNIDQTIYVRLVSSRGERFGQRILSDTDF